MRGVTLIEVAILLTATLAVVGLLAPTLSAVVLRAETVTAQATMANIDDAINDVLGDLPHTYFTWDGTWVSAAGSVGVKVQLVVGDGDIPADVSGTGSATWQSAVNNTTVDYLERHLISNTPGGTGAYTTAVANSWRGAYLNGPLDPDPWGNRYMVNSLYLGTGGANNNDVVVLSAGPDEEIDSPFTALNFNALADTGDDLWIIQEGN
jgi:hypothetical protein